MVCGKFGQLELRRRRAWHAAVCMCLPGASSAGHLPPSVRRIYIEVASLRSCAARGVVLPALSPRMLSSPESASDSGRKRAGSWLNTEVDLDDYRKNGNKRYKTQVEMRSLGAGCPAWPKGLDGLLVWHSCRLLG